MLKHFKSLPNWALTGLLLAGSALASVPAPALAGGGDGLSWTQPQAVLQLQGGTPLIWASNLAVENGNQYWVYADSSATPWLASNVGGTWQNYNLGVQGLEHSGATTPFGNIAVQNGVVYIPYLGSDGLLYLDYNPSGSPKGPWVQVNVVPSTSASCGLGTETENPSAAIAGGTLYVSFQDGGPCNVSGAGQVYLASIAISSLPASGGSATWNTVNVTAATGDSTAPALASDGQNVSLAWDLNTGGLEFLGGVSSSQAQAVFTAPTDFYNTTQMAAGQVFGATGTVHAIAMYGGMGDANYVATDDGGSWSNAQVGLTGRNGNDHSSVAVGSCGPAVAYDDTPADSYVGSVHVAYFGAGQWNPQTVGVAQTNPLQLPALAAIPGGFDLTYVNNDNSSPELYAATGYCPPEVNSIDPTEGSSTGGDIVHIAGQDFTGATAVDFGANPATDVSVRSDTGIVATSPAGTGTVDVTVTTPGGTSATGSADQFTYSAGGQGGNSGSNTGSTGGGNSSGGPTFNDIGGYDWAAGAIESLAGEGIIKGTGPGTFDPAGHVTRAQFAALMQRTFSLAAASQPLTFNDVDSSSWEYAPVEALTPYMDYYQVPGGGYAFHPDQAMDRQDVATVMVKILAASGKIQVLSASDAQAVMGKITDASDIAPALQTYAATAVKAGLMTGFPDGTFQPPGSLTRAQIAVLIQRLQNDFLVTSPAS